MNIKEIKEILELMKEHGLNEVEIEKDGLKIKLSKGRGGKIVEQIVEAPSAVVPVPTSAPAAAAPDAAASAPADDANVEIVKSPMVGTFYAAPSPDQPPYVTAGQAVKTGAVLCIIEAMKLMNEIKSEVNGTVVEVLVENGQPVEFDQPIYKIKKS